MHLFALYIWFVIFNFCVQRMLHCVVYTLNKNDIHISCHFLVAKNKSHHRLRGPPPFWSVVQISDLGNNTHAIAVKIFDFGNGEP